MLIKVKFVKSALLLRVQRKIWFMKIEVQKTLKIAFVSHVGNFYLLEEFRSYDYIILNEPL